MPRAAHPGACRFRALGTLARWPLVLVWVGLAVAFVPPWVWSLVSGEEDCGSQAGCSPWLLVLFTGPSGAVVAVLGVGVWLVRRGRGPRRPRTPR